MIANENESLEVYQYGIEALCELLAKKSKNTLAAIKQRSHSQYFEEYFNKLQAKTILVENKYVDRDFLEDFSAYYVRCFHPYKRFCTRLHFFTCEFSERGFAKLLENPCTSEISPDLLNEHYLGFIVVKPLPETVIGRTCLKTYPEENHRKFPVVRKYSANPFGLELEVTSLAFQEQDSVTSACATSALWSAFHGTGKRFQHPIPSPVEITRSATKGHPLRTRAFPNHGLEIPMMAHAIRDVGLEPYHEGIGHLGVLKETIYAYLRGQIPAVLGVELWDKTQALDEPVAWHAVSVTGYSLAKGSSKNSPKNFLTKARNMAKIYVHDDQVGPFARMNFDGFPLQLPDLNYAECKIPVETLSTSFRLPAGEIGDIRAVPISLLIPLYHKIRIPYDIVLETVRSFDGFIKLIATEETSCLAPDAGLEWDIYLTTNNDLKREILRLDSSAMMPPHRNEVLRESMPRFLWRASAYQNEVLLLDLLFDATDIEHGQFFVRAIEWEEKLSSALRWVSGVDIDMGFDTTETQAAQKIIAWFREQENVKRHRFLDSIPPRPRVPASFRASSGVRRPRLRCGRSRLYQSR